MGDYNLAALSTREFEHLIQALALKNISPGVTPYGDGPDGGREATCRGQMEYHRATNENWNGYLVVQAKFCQQPTGDSQKDGKWALDELRKELLKFSDPKRKLPSPEYYLFATNLKLTAVQDTGSKDRAFKVLADFTQSLGLTDYDIWDYDKICRLLDNAEDIRNRYAHFIAPGDVLSYMMKRLKGYRPNFETVMAKYLQGEFLTERYARLVQAGHSGKEDTALERVFIDLPAPANPTHDPPDEQADAKGRMPNGFLAELLDAAGQKLDRRSVMRDRAQHEVAAEEPTRPEPGRFVLVGGPGQGKSTLGQFLCQLYRVAILKDRDKSNLAVELVDPLDHFQEQCQNDGIQLPAARRFPVRVVLSRLADELAAKRVDTLLDYVASQIGKLTAEKVEVDDLRRWLSAYPWVIVLDGLDEVPATSNRADVLGAVQQFWIDCADCEADVLVVATTRPQGYSDEFSPRHYQHRYLAPLSTARAIHYARRLAEERFGPDLARKEEVLKLLTSASQDDATARLMRSPLQVTIMHTLVEQGGEPPRERWKLFRAYYRVIYDREKQKGTELSKVLNEHSDTIDFIHRQVALRLQIDSEGAGTAEGLLPADQLRAMITARLTDLEYPGDLVRTDGDKIHTAAMERLVFLVAPQQDHVGFEIRSLQEFMAADALTNDYVEEKQLVDRLKHIGPISHWRNVFLFAAGRCFSERDHLGETLVGICNTLNNDDDRVCSTALAGSRLALDLLEDGAARQKPKFLKALAGIALKLLDLPSEDAHVKLATVFQSMLEAVYHEDLVARLMRKPWQSTLGAWRVLIECVDKNHVWAIELAENHWPGATNHQSAILAVTHGYFRRSRRSAWVRSKLVDLAPRIESMGELFMFQQFLLPGDEAEVKIPDWLAAGLPMVPFFADPVEAAATVRLDLGVEPPLKLSIIRVATELPSSRIPYSILPELKGPWAAPVAAACFTATPTGKTLVGILRWLVGRWDPERHGIGMSNAAWPLQACLDSCRTEDDLRDLADRAEAGQFGDRDDWEAAETRWVDKGITAEDISSVTDDRWPYDRAVRERGFPYCFQPSFLSLMGSNAQEALERLYGLHRKLPASKTRSMVSNWIVQAYRACGRNFRRVNKKEWLALPSPQRLKTVLVDLDQTYFDMGVLYALAWPTELFDDWIEVLDWLGGRDSRLHPSRPPIVSNLVKAMAKAFSEDPKRLGILRLLACCAEGGTVLPVAPDLLDDKRFDKPKDRLNASRVRLAVPDLSEADAERLAATIYEASGDNFSAESEAVLVSLVSRDAEGQAAERFVLSVLGKISAEDDSARQIAHRLLSGWLARRRSRLGNIDQQRALGLDFLANLPDVR